MWANTTPAHAFSHFHHAADQSLSAPAALNRRTGEEMELWSTYTLPAPVCCQREEREVPWDAKVAYFCSALPTP